ncbi:MAG: PHP domain-containing protein [Methanothrix sp.]|jgi:predicted metal-dependent phosphoesterase TrpH|uniref:CehA/McbA family metallohydrolase n=1 Tax=Methanothrix sp. TaxID=90426 RepID=UPI00247ECE42|nr:PHP domain-containing protein [Methanothrix sp.]
MRFDLHIHSRYSDGRASVEEILRVARRKGLDGIAVTDHNTLDGSRAALQISRSSYRELIVVRGVELDTSEGHLIVLGVDEMPEPGITPEETIEEAHDLGGIAVLPHPYHLFRHSIGRIPPVDAVEVCNSKYILGLSNLRAKLEARRQCIPMVAGSDAHLAETVGLGITILNAASEDDVLEEIRKSRTEIDCCRTPFGIVAKRLARKIYRRVRH